MNNLQIQKLKYEQRMIILLKYKLIGESNIYSPIKTIFNNRGIIDYEKFLNLTEDSEHDLYLLDNIEEAADKLIEHIKLNNTIFIQIDEDTDGYCSSSIMYNYLIRLGVDSNLVKWRVHGKKKHGITPEAVPDDVNLVIIPDAASGQYEEHRELASKGKEIIILDHHEADKYSEHAIVVNNQLSQNYPNKQLSATGVVYKFLKLVDEKLGVNFAEDDLDIMAIGLIADVMSTREEETRYYIQQGLKKIKNPLIREIIKINSSYVDVNNLTIKGVSWTIAPRINAVTRVGTVKEREDMFKSMTIQDLDMTDIKKVAGSLEEIRERQNELRDKGELIVQSIIDDNKLWDDHIIIVNIGRTVDGVSELAPSLGGLVAVRVAQKYKKPTLILRESDEGILSGSGRGYEQGIIPDLKSFLNNSGQVIMAEGHDNAHGVKIKKNKVKELLNLTEKVIVPSLDGGINLNEYQVDFIVKNKTLNYGLVSLLDSYKHAWGKNVEEPKFAIEDVQIERRNIQVFGKKTTVMKFTSGTIEYIKFNVTNDEIMSLRDGDRNDTLKLTIIGTPEVNTFRGKTTSQVVMDDFNIKDVYKQKYAF